MKNLFSRVSAVPKGLIAIGLLVAVFVAFSGDMEARSLVDLNRQRQEIRDATAELRAHLAAAQEEQNDVLAEMILLDIELTEVGGEHLIALENLEYTMEILAETEKALAEAEEAREARFAVLASRLRFMHENNNLSYIELLFSSQNLTEFLSNREHFRRIIEHDNNIVSQLVELEQEIAAKKDEIDAQRIALETQTAELEAAMVALEIILEERAVRLAQIAESTADYQDQINDAVARDRAVSLEIAAAQAEANRIMAEQRLRELNAAIARIDANAPMLWPVQGQRSINSEYGWRTNPVTRRREFHEGIDLRAPHGTQVLAAKDGVVTFSGWRSGYGNTIIIDHGGGLSTLYAHQSSNSVRQWDVVDRGQQIGRSGSTGMATGAHLHFEVRQNGNHVDPGPFLGLR
jgi:murein DD-endopeptidase MepM/ murein hydrolase activator NlpD